MTGFSDISTAPPISADAEAGFSLLEILAALVIIALMTAAVVLSLKPPASGQNDIRDKLVVQLNQAAKNSIYTGRVNALSVSAEGLQIMSYREGAWSVTQDFPALARVRAQLQIENEKVALPETARPLILFEPTGEITDFNLSLRGVELDINIFSAENGAIQIGQKS